MRVPGKPTPLRERMIGDMKLCGYAPRTIEAYVNAVRGLARHCRRAPDLLHEEQVRAYLLDLTERGVARGTHSIALSGIRFLYQHTLRREWLTLDVARPRHESKLPVVLSRDEVWEILDEVRIPVYRACLTTIYACGLRLMEGATLSVPQVDGRRMLLHIHGKGGTWARNLAYHPHVHLLVSAGGLDGDAWRKPRNPRFLVPGFLLQARLRSRLRAAFRTAGVNTGTAAWWSDWVAHVKRLRSGEHALAYLARYLFRVAISDRSILSADDDRVRFRYVDARTGNVKRPVLASHDFLARFLAHVLPRRFVKVRTYGLWASACRRHLDLARSLLAIHHVDRGATSASPAVSSDTNGGGDHHSRCPFCATGRMLVVEVFPRPRSPP